MIFGPWLLAVLASNIILVMIQDRLLSGPAFAIGAVLSPVTSMLALAAHPLEAVATRE